MIIALASPCIASALDEGLDKIKRFLSEASAQGAEIVCFPEAYLPGLWGQDFEVLPFDQTQQERTLRAVAQWARMYEVATILGTEKLTEAGRQIVAFVIDSLGQIQGHQTKNQLDPTEDQFYVPGKTRQLFEINGIKFGVVICHEGWRYPETVRWAAVRGAKIVFHPHHTGSNQKGVRLTKWGAASGPYYEKAMILRSMENTIYFANVNYALRFQESATSLIAPSGQCQAYLPYGQEGVLVQAVEVGEATGLLAARYAPERYQEFTLEWAPNTGWVTHYVTLVVLLKYWKGTASPRAQPRGSSAGRGSLLSRRLARFVRRGKKAAMPKRPGKAAVRGWLGVFIVLPVGVWLAASLRSGFREKSLSNLCLEPLMIALLSIAVFVMWFSVARRGLRPSVGIILLIILLAAALAVQRFVPHLRE
jgi:predicted amidohydrolase